MELQLRISGFHYEKIKKHLLRPDLKEAIAVALCGRYMDKDSQIMLVHDLVFIPDEECYIRENDLLHWSTQRIQHYFEKIAKSDFALLKIHSHPNGYNKFSIADNRSDLEFFDSAFGWSNNDKPHASAIMLPSGDIFGRFFFHDLHYEPINKITIIGDIIQHYFSANALKSDSSFGLRTIQTFGEKTYKLLNNLSVGVVGCSGTGSIIIEQLVRLGIGELILVDPDFVEKKNLNRIIHAKLSDAKKKNAKVDVISRSINRMNLGTIVKTYKSNLYDNIEALKSLIKCDVIFGCVDSVDGRHLLNQLCTFYILPYFDLGVKLEADGKGGIKQICCSTHYIQPTKSSLITRGVYTMEDLRAASQFRKNPEEFSNLRRNSYIKNVNVNNPAVISVNMQISSHAINEFLNRIHPYKVEPPSCYAASTIDITEGYVINSNEKDFRTDEYLSAKCGRGDILPFIEISELAI